MSRNLMTWNETSTGTEMHFLSDLHSGRSNVLTWDGGVASIDPRGELNDYAVPNWNGNDRYYLRKFAGYVIRDTDFVTPTNY